MDVTPLLKQGTNIIQSYKDGVFRIGGQNYEYAILVNANTLSAWNGSFDTLPPHDVLLYGTGSTQIWPPAELRARVNMEVMTTPAACRTYNALISEGRNVLAILEVYTAD